MEHNTWKHPMGVILLGGLLALNLPLANAGGSCKGMEKSMCATNPSCRWVKSYTRSNGKQVAGYCRSLPKRKDSKKREK